MSVSFRKIRVGVVGLQAGRSWAAVAHLPALRYLSENYEIVGVANSSRASAQAAAEACGIQRAFVNVEDMVASPDVDLVAVTVKVPAHFDLVRAALKAGKHVFCEWPLGRTLDEAENARAACGREGPDGVHQYAGSGNARDAAHERLVSEGFVGEVLSTTVSGWGRIWGGTVADLNTDGYLLDDANGATMLTIPVAHTLAATSSAMSRRCRRCSQRVTLGCSPSRRASTCRRMPPTEY